MNHSLKSKIILAILIVLLFFTISAIKGNNKNISIYIPKTLSSIPILELDKKSINNISIKTEFYQDNIMAMAEFIQGKFDIFMTGFTQGVSNYKENKNIMHVATPVWGVSSLIVKDPSLKKLDDLAGKTILVPFAKSPLELQLKAIIKNEGLGDNIIINYSPSQQAIPMLLTGKTDAICVPEPLSSKLVLQNKTYVFFNFADKWGEINNGEKRSPQVSLFVNKDFAKNNNGFLKQFIQQIKNEVENIKKEPGNYSNKYSQLFELDINIIENGIKNTLFDIPNFKETKKICYDYLNKIEYSKEEIEDQFFFKY